MIAKRESIEGIGGGRLRRLVSAGEPLNPEIIDVFRNALGLDIHDGYGRR
jgi:medium-chain acyl-CoA synthetase